MLPLKEETIPVGIRNFSMYRTNDSSGVSGTGLVLLGTIFPNGRICVQWVCPPDPGDTQIKDSFHKFLTIHVFTHLGNNTIISFQDGERWLYNDENPVGTRID